MWRWVEHSADNPRSSRVPVHITRAGAQLARFVTAAAALAPLAALALPQRQDLSVIWSPLFGTVNTTQKAYPFFTAVGSTFLYRYSITPRLLLDLGYEIQNSGTKLAFHGPDLGLAYSFYGRPSFAINDAPVTLAVTYPLEAHVGIGAWIREHDFSPLFPASAALLSQTENFLSKGSVIGIQALLGASIELSADVRLLMRMRFLQGSTSNISGGSIRAASPQLGLTARL